MANTNPVNDDPSVTDYILERARKDSPVRVYPVAAATKGLAGEVMTEMVALAKAGAVAFSDDGKTIMDSGMQRRVLEYSKLTGKPVMVHAEDRCLVNDGVVNEGPVSTELGLPGNPAIAEMVHVARDIQLAELTGAHLHVAHVSTAGAVVLIREAKRSRRARDGRGLAASSDTHRRSDARLQTRTRRWHRRCAARRTWPRASRASPTARSTRSPPIMRRTPCTRRKSSSPRRRPGILGFETALPVVLALVRNNS